MNPITKLPDGRYPLSIIDLDRHQYAAIMHTAVLYNGIMHEIFREKFTHLDVSSRVFSPPEQSSRMRVELLPQFNGYVYYEGIIRKYPLEMVNPSNIFTSQNSRAYDSLRKDLIERLS